MGTRVYFTLPAPVLPRLFRANEDEFRAACALVEEYTSALHADPVGGDDDVLYDRIQANPLAADIHNFRVSGLGKVTWAASKLLEGDEYGSVAVCEWSDWSPDPEKYTVSRSLVRLIIQAQDPSRFYGDRLDLDVLTKYVTEISWA